jgi:sulfonate transport system substrate-binding protein
MPIVLRALAILSLIAAIAGPTRSLAADAPKELRIGYQKIGVLLIIKEQQRLERRFASQGIAVRWVEFQSGPPLLEALNAGAIDFGYTGDTPPIFAQAAGAQLVYVASIPNPGKSNAILVRNDSGIKSIADLRGKRIAFARGSSAHNVLVRVLEKAGIGYGDIVPVNLQPADAAAAFRNGSIDAWSIWDPFYALGERFPGVHVLTNAEGFAPSNSFFLAGRDFAAHYPEVVSAIVDEVTQASRWAQTHQQDLASVLAAETGVDLDVERVAAARGDYAVAYITPNVVRQQQSIADTFAKLGLIPHAIDVRSIVWLPNGRVLGSR